MIHKRQVTLCMYTDIYAGTLIFSCYVRILVDIYFRKGIFLKTCNTCKEIYSLLVYVVYYNNITNAGLRKKGVQHSAGLHVYTAHTWDGAVRIITRYVL